MTQIELKRKTYEELQETICELMAEYDSLGQSLESALDGWKKCREKNKKLQKALDKACELLEPNVTKREFHVDEYGEFDIDVPIRNKEEWKEYLLNED